MFCFTTSKLKNTYSAKEENTLKVVSHHTCYSLLYCKDNIFVQTNPDILQKSCKKY